VTFAGVAVVKYKEVNVKQKKSVKYYLNVFKKFDNEGKHTWNWAAFFLGCRWLGYRKMYRELAIIYAIDCIALVVALCLFQGNRDSFNTLLLLIDAFTLVFAGYYGNTLYYRKVKNMIGRGAHEIPGCRPTSLVSAIIPFAWMLFWLADYIIIKRHKQRVSNTDISEENVIKYLDLSHHRQKSPYNAIATLLGITLPFILIMLVYAYGKSKYPVDQQAISTKMEKIKENLDKTND